MTLLEIVAFLALAITLLLGGFIWIIIHFEPYKTRWQNIVNAWRE